MENQFISYLSLPQKRDAGLRIFQQAIKQQNGYNPLASLKSLQHQAYQPIKNLEVSLHQSVARQL